MKKNIIILSAFALFLSPRVATSQTITLGTAANFALFSSVGAVTNTSISQVTGNVGSNSGSATGFGNVNGIMDDNNGASALSATDLLVAYNQLNAATPTFFPSTTLGNGDTLIPGIYHIGAAAILNLDLILDGQGNSNAVFIFQIQGAFSTHPASKVKLVNGTKACNVYWKVEGLVSMAAGTTMRGTVIANNAAINIYAGDTLEGRALTTNGSVTIDGSLIYTPNGCGSPLLTGPAAPVLASVKCFAIFSSDGSVSNSGITHVSGDVGTNVGLTTGFNPLYVTGSIHPIPDGSTAACAADLHNVYTYLNTLPYDIELLYPAQFGRNLVLTPHTYLLNAATTFTDTLYLNAEGDDNAVFVIQINGALSTSTFANVVLINGAQAKNIFWKVEGAVNINDSSVFIGTIICNNGAISLHAIDTLIGRVLTTAGSLSTVAVSVAMPIGCGVTSVNELGKSEQVTIAPNPFGKSIAVTLSNLSQTTTYKFKMYSMVGVEILSTTLSNSSTTVETNSIPSGIYFYKITGNDTIIETGKLIAE